MNIQDCPHCKTRVVFSTDICPSCLKSRTTAERPSSPMSSGYSSTANSKNVFCPECGTKIIKGGKFCAQCGHRLLIESEPVDAPAQSAPDVSNQVMAGDSADDGAQTPQPVEDQVEVSERDHREPILASVVIFFLNLLYSCRFIILLALVVVGINAFWGGKIRTVYQDIRKAHLIRQGQLPPHSLTQEQLEEVEGKICGEWSFENDYINFKADGRFELMRKADWTSGVYPEASGRWVTGNIHPAISVRMSYEKRALGAPNPDRLELVEESNGLNVSGLSQGGSRIFMATTRRQFLASHAEKPISVPTSHQPRIVVFPEARERALAATEAMGRGDLREVKNQLSGSNCIVDLKNDWPPDALPESQRRLAEGLLHLVEGDLRGAYEAGHRLLHRTEVVYPDDPLAHVLLAFTFSGLGVFPLADDHAFRVFIISRSRSDLGVSGQLVSAFSQGGVPRSHFEKRFETTDANGKGWITSWQHFSRGSEPGQQRESVIWFWFEDRAPKNIDDPQIILTWQPNWQFVGALTVESAGDSTKERPHYRLVFRDLDAPPLVILDCGATPPAKGELLEFASRFSARVCPGTNSLLRVQMEALHYQRAGLAPLAAKWRRAFPESDPLLDKEVQQPLEEAHSWQWEQVGQWPVGSPQGSDKPASYEVTGYVNRETTPPDALRKLSGPLEHFHFGVNAREKLPDIVRKLAGPPDNVRLAVKAREKQTYVASYRLVSQPLESGKRLFRIERVIGQQVSILEVLTRMPSWPQMADKVVDWISGDNRPLHDDLALRMTARDNP